MELMGLRGAKIPNGDLLLCGGKERYGGTGYEYLLLKNGSNEWKNVGTTKTRRVFHSSVFIDGRLFTSGGHCSYLPFSNHEEFSFERGVKEKMDMPILVYGHTATIFGPGKILICGGVDKNVSKTIYWSKTKIP